MLLTAALTLVLGALAGEAPHAHHRGDGAGRFPDATVPSFEAKDRRWTQPAPAWSNAAPVLFAGQVCALAEPTTVWCVDADTGAPTWSAQLDVLDALSGEARAEAEAARAAALVAEARYAEVRQQWSALRRELRRDPEAMPRLEAADRELKALEPVLEAGRPYITPPVREIVGYTSHSPLTDGTRLYVLLGTGLVAALGPQGERLWSTWLGPAPTPRRGYHLGTCATPVLVDGSLVVGWDHLVALDAATGQERWRGEPPYALYGSPAVARPDGRAVVVTPDGFAHDARSGDVLAEGLGDAWFVGPSVDGDELMWIGRRVEDPRREPQGRIVAEAVRLRGATGPLAVARLWRTELPTRDAVYNAAVPAPSGWWVGDALGRIWRLDRADGTSTLVDDPRGTPAYASPVSLGDTLLVVNDDGMVRLVDLASGEVTLRTRLGPTRATPLASGRRVWIRTLEELLALGVP